MMLAIIEARHRASEKKQGDLAWLAWTTAGLGRVKKFPKLKDILPKGRKQQPAGKSWQEQLTVAQAWTAALARKD